MTRWRGQESRMVDQPEPGFFRMRLTNRGPYVAARIEHADGLWRATIDDVVQDPAHADPAKAEGVLRIWHGAMRVDEDSYNHALAISRWARENDPNHPAANPTQPVNIGKMKPPF
jgi:hypothetical protein